jgi:SAM-dependent methyltransferase
MSQYIFNDTQYDPELERLQAIERIFDRLSRQQIQSTGITSGWHCLEVGAGAGSMARWMAELVKPSGKVVAVDLDTRFISHLKSSHLEIVQGDIRDLSLEPQSFDLVRARYVLIHIQDFQAAISKMLNCLKPGGWIAIEEPDFSAAKAISGDEVLCQSVERVNRAIARMFANKGMDCALGIKLPAIFEGLGLQLKSVLNDVPLSRGGSELAKLMKMSALQLADKYIATGETSEEDIHNYCLFADNPDTWAIYYGTVGVTAQKP